MHRKWGYLLENDVAPVWVGEFGTASYGDEGAHHYWDSLMRSLTAYDADWGYWALNPRKPENYDVRHLSTHDMADTDCSFQNETYGLLEDDWETPVLDWRLASLQKLMKPQE